MKVVAIALGCPGHGVHVEPVCPRANHAAQAAGAKLQFPVKTILYRRLIAENVL